MDLRNQLEQRDATCTSLRGRITSLESQASFVCSAPGSVSWHIEESLCHLMLLPCLNCSCKLSQRRSIQSTC